ncbi:MAG: hypothetical protein PUB39_05585 [Eubacteriales bacterium]|nr:hypothetical protein [Eubacteriales bacterium]
MLYSKRIAQKLIILLLSLCMITILMPGISFAESEKPFFELNVPDEMTLDSPPQGTTYDYHDYNIYICSQDYDNSITKAEAADTSVVRFKKDYDDESDEDSDVYYIVPKKAGTTTVTLTDSYGQTKQIQLTITPQFVDDYKYLEKLADTRTELEYGAEITGNTMESASVTAEIEGKTYTAKANYNGYFHISTPAYPAGTSVSMTYSKGLSTYSEILKIKPTEFGYIELSSYYYTYNNKVKTPAVTVYDSYDNDEYYTKISKENYTVSYPAGRINVGSYKVKVTGKYNYIGSDSETFDIYPGTPRIAKITSGSKKLTVTLSKAPSVYGASTYQIAYKVKGGSWKYTNASSNSTKKVIKKLKSKKYYYVKARAWKKVSGKKYYSSWTGSKKVKVK